MAGRKSDFTLPTNTLDELFSSQEERDEAKLSKIRDIPLEEIDDFPDHPFKVREDEDMFQLVESIKERGVITPATVRQKEDGRYELISGHRRKRACELAGFICCSSTSIPLTSFLPFGSVCVNTVLMLRVLRRMWTTFCRAIRQGQCSQTPNLSLCSIRLPRTGWSWRSS